MELYRSISRIVATALFAASLVLASLSLPESAMPDPSLQWSVRIKDSALNVVTVEGKVFGRTGRKFAFSAVETETGGRLEPIGLRAFGPGGKPLETTVSGGLCEVRCEKEDFTVVYDLVMTIEDMYTPEIREMLSFLGQGRSRLIGRDIFLQPAGRVAEGVVVDLFLHGGSRIGAPWETAGGRMIVPSVSDLPMTLVVAGDYRLLETSVSGIGLTLAVGGEWEFEDGELLETIRRIVSQEISMFGSSPRDRHLVICDPNPVRGGQRFDYYGVHFGGTILLLLDPALDRSALYGAPMSIIAHEFFHNWNGEVLRPSDRTFMWFTEGATVYFSYLVLSGAGIISDGQREDADASISARFIENPLRGSVPLTEAGNGDLSDRDMVRLLYDGGYVASRGLDLRIRALSAGRVGLIDILRGLYVEDSGGREIGVEDLIEAVRAATGSDLSNFMDMLLRDPSAVPVNDVSS